jgi:hypothetical protein
VNLAILREARLRFIIFSREELWFYAHVHCVDGQATFWREPPMVLAQEPS